MLLRSHGVNMGDEKPTILYSQLQCFRIGNKSIYQYVQYSRAGYLTSSTDDQTANNHQTTGFSCRRGSWAKRPNSTRFLPNTYNKNMIIAMKYTKSRPYFKINDISMIHGVKLTQQCLVME